MNRKITKHEQRIKDIQEMVRTGYISLETGLQLLGDEYRRFVLDDKGLNTSGIDLDFEFVREWGEYPKTGVEAIL